MYVLVFVAFDEYGPTPLDQTLRPCNNFHKPIKHPAIRMEKLDCAPQSPCNFPPYSNYQNQNQFQESPTRSEQKSEYPDDRSYSQACE
ncbi:predicted protein [Botrytis cinerea T4]|uniref:Uncharacterized protein n=1 Tax=Botryotinia fuckeliana (strain T4) TaxID=999810 RepID=G2YIF6_BOTF4|nr:predicted protein [Botrytis cinerea T4]